MLDTLQKMSGTTHKVYRDTKQVTRDMEKLILQNEGKVSISLSVKEQPVIAYNDLAFMPMCNSIVFRAGDSPIWNRNQTCLPMSYQLFKNTIVQPGKAYSLQTVPTLSSAADFDVRQNMPNFIKMWEKRYAQSLEVEPTVKAYRDAYHYDDDSIARLDPDKYADEIMMFVNQRVAEKAAESAKKQAEEDGRNFDGVIEMDYEENTALSDSIRANEALAAQWGAKVFCSGMLSKDDLCPMSSGRSANHSWDDVILSVFADERMQKAMVDGTTYDEFHIASDGSITDPKGQVLIQHYVAGVKDVEVNGISKDAEAKLAEQGAVISDYQKYESEEHDGWQVMDALYTFLVNQVSWARVAKGVFEEVFTEVLRGSDLVDSNN